MRIGIIGGGVVGQTMAAGLMAQGHEVRLGIRDPSTASLAQQRAQALPLADWQAKAGGRVVTIAEAANFGEVVMNATSGHASLEALRLAGAEALNDKVLVDIANPLDFSQGMPPFLLRDYAGPTSLGEAIQAAIPKARVVKAFNTIAAAVMVEPARVPGEHDLFIAGDDDEAKSLVTEIARGFGWRRIVDLGDIKGARASESLLPVWVRLWGVTGTPDFNLHLARA